MTAIRICFVLILTLAAAGCSVEDTLIFEVPVNDTTALAIDSDRGYVIVRVDPDADAVTVTVMKHGLVSKASLTVAEEESFIGLDADSTDPDAFVDLEVTLPEGLSITIDAHEGPVWVFGARDGIDAATSEGDLTVGLAPDEGADLIADGDVSINVGLT
ncbi:MAG: hypothetical protein GY898_28250 [Proteobacteria bacterium]|nr:hypothetical protein [Pseudomonadota bacterium]